MRSPISGSIVVGELSGENHNQESSTYNNIAPFSNYDDTNIINNI